MRLREWTEINFQQDDTLSMSINTPILNRLEVKKPQNQVTNFVFWTGEMLHKTFLKLLNGVIELKKWAQSEKKFKIEKSETLWFGGILQKVIFSHHENDNTKTY